MSDGSLNVLEIKSYQKVLAVSKLVGVAKSQYIKVFKSTLLI